MKKFIFLLLLLGLIVLSGCTAGKEGIPKGITLSELGSTNTAYLLMKDILESPTCNDHLCPKEHEQLRVSELLIDCGQNNLGQSKYSIEGKHSCQVVKERVEQRLQYFFYDADYQFLAKARFETQSSNLIEVGGCSEKKEIYSSHPFPLSFGERGGFVEAELKIC